MNASAIKNYVGGQWISPENFGLLDVEQPSTADVIAQVPLSTAAETDRAVAAARKAFDEWSVTPVSRRCDLLWRLTSRIRDNSGDLARIISRENGKSLPDATAEVKRALENAEVACGMPMLQQGDKLPGASLDIDGEVLRMPLGVFGMIAPFNFPLMVPFWFFPYALATGNTFMTRVTEMIHEIGFPPGVFNLVHGDKRAAEALLNSRDIAGISFVGTSKVGRIIAERCTETGKRFQAMGGAKNHLVAMPDAKMDEIATWLHPATVVPASDAWLPRRLSLWGTMSIVRFVASLSPHRRRFGLLILWILEWQTSPWLWVR